MAFNNGRRRFTETFQGLHMFPSPNILVPQTAQCSVCREQDFLKQS